MNLNIDAEKQITYDAIVVGSGISGGWAAKELTGKGLKVLLLERGRNVEHRKDYTYANKDPWEMPHRGMPTQEQLIPRPVIERTWGKSEAIMDYWARDVDAPYTE